jgi:hypothetical protein
MRSARLAALAVTSLGKPKRTIRIRQYWGEREDYDGNVIRGESYDIYEQRNGRSVLHTHHLRAGEVAYTIGTILGFHQ